MAAVDVDARCGRGGATATVFVERLRLHALIGVDELERVVGNDFEVTLCADVPGALAAATTDNLDLTVSYADLVAVIMSVMAEPMMLVEHAAWRIIETVRLRWPGITAIELTVAKLAPPVEGTQCASMGVTFRWSR